MKRLWLLALCCLSCAAAWAQVQIAYDTIPFRIVHGKFIVEAALNGRRACFILDTGGINAVVSDSVEAYGIRLAGQKALTGVNNAAMAFRKGQVDSLLVGSCVRWRQTEVTIVPGNGFFRSLGVAGILGGECFRSVCLVIDKANRRLCISYPYRPKGISRSAGTLMNFGTGVYSLIPVEFGSGNRSCQVLFDTGMPDVMSLSLADYRRILSSAEGKQAQSAAMVEQRGYGFTNVGIGGIKYAKADSLYLVRIHRLTLPGGKTFANVGALAQTQSQTLIGQGILDYGTVMLDYPRKLFYFFPYSNEPTDLASVTAQWNVKILPIDGHFEVTASLGSCAARIGDHVLSINGKSLAGMEQSQIAIDELLEAIPDNKAWIEVGEGKQKKKIKIEKQ